MATFSQLWNAGNQPKPRKMAADWDNMKSDYASAMNVAATRKGVAIKKAEADRNNIIADAKIA